MLIEYGWDTKKTNYVSMRRIDTQTHTQYRQCSTIVYLIDSHVGQNTCEYDDTD